MVARYIVTVIWLDSTKSATEYRASSWTAMPNGANDWFKMNGPTGRITMIPREAVRSIDIDDLFPG